MPITFFVRKIGPVHIAEPGLMARRQTGGRWQVADEIQVNLEIFNNHCTSKDFFLLRLTKVRHHYSSRNAFQVFLRVKSIVKLVKPGAPGFLKLILCGLSVCVFACVCVCPPPRLLITSGVMWHDIDSIRLVKQVLQLLYSNYSLYR